MLFRSGARPDPDGAGIAVLRRTAPGLPRLSPLGPDQDCERRGQLKIYLIAPKNPESFWTFDRVLPSIGKRCAFPNLALPTVAGLTPAGHEVVLCDENVERIDFDTDADVVGITGFAVHKRRIFEIAEAFRRRGKLVAAGGPFATLCPEELRGRVDVLFVGEAEYTWPRFVRGYEDGIWQPEIGRAHV